MLFIVESILFESGGNQVLFSILVTIVIILPLVHSHIFDSMLLWAEALFPTYTQRGCFEYFKFQPAICFWFNILISYQLATLVITSVNMCFSWLYTCFYFPSFCKWKSFYNNVKLCCECICILCSLAKNWYESKKVLDHIWDIFYLIMLCMLLLLCCSLTLEI